MPKTRSSSPCKAVVVEIREEPIAALAAYCAISIGFKVSSEFVVEERGIGFDLVERAVEPWMKDYDTFAGASPEVLPARFDITEWPILSAWISGERVGGALLAWRTPGIDLLEGRDDLVVVWDLRITEGWRGFGIGRMLWERAESWGREHGGSTIKVETQNTNVGACRFYERMGCDLRRVDRHAYEDAPGESQLLWYKDLT